MWVNLRDEVWNKVLKLLHGHGKLANEATVEIMTAKADLADEEHNYYRELADDKKARDGELEFDSDAVVSLGNDNGAYVMGWAWVEDDREQEDEEDEEDEPVKET